MKRSLLFLLTATLVCAAPDKLRYEKMTLKSLVAEVLSHGASDGTDQNSDFEISVARAFSVGETSESTFRRALQFQKEYPYCVHVTMSPDAPKWGLCIFRFTRDGDTISGKEELWIYFTTKDRVIADVTWTRSIWDL